MYTIFKIDPVINVNLLKKTKKNVKLFVHKVQGEQKRNIELTKKMQLYCLTLCKFRVAVYFVA